MTEKSYRRVIDLFSNIDQSRGLTCYLLSPKIKYDSGFMNKWNSKDTKIPSYSSLFTHVRYLFRYPNLSVDP